MKSIEKRRSCNLCGSLNINRSILRLGNQPPADTFISDPSVYVIKAPLNLCICDNCRHVFTEYYIDPKLRYVETEYSYTSDNSSISVKHFTELAQFVSKFFLPGDHILEFGSNSGFLLYQLQSFGAKVLGVDPSSVMSNLATSRGIQSHTAFFGEHFVKSIACEDQFNVVIGTNVLNHIDNLEDTMIAVGSCLKEEGYFIFEVPSLEDLLSDLAFETVYHEHVNYFSLSALIKLLEKYDFGLSYYEKSDYMCGSWRIVAKKNNPSIIKSDEFSLNSDFTKFLDQINRTIQVSKTRILTALQELYETNAITVAVGAATKGNTFLNTFEISSPLIREVYDTSKHKIGKFMPGSRIPILDENIETEFTHFVVLPYNIEKHILKIPKYSKKNFFDYKKIIKECSNEI